MQIRLQKVLAQAGVSSRRKAEELITSGRVEVNGQVVTELGTRVDPASDIVKVDGKLIAEREQKVYFVLYKPPRVVTTFSDPQGRATVKDYLGGIEQRVFAVGRLDYDAEGALILTNDGELANKLMHPKYEVPRTYLVKVKGVPDDETLQKLRDGVRLEDGLARPEQVEVFEQTPRNTWLKLVVREGRPHLIKRLVAAVGHPAVRLYRPSYAGIPARGVRPGHYRQLSGPEVETLWRATQGKTTEGNEELGLPARQHGRTSVLGELEDEGESELPGEELEDLIPPPAPKTMSPHPLRGRRPKPPPVDEQIKPNLRKGVGPRVPREERTERPPRQEPDDRPSPTTFRRNAPEAEAGAEPRRRREPGAFGDKMRERRPRTFDEGRGGFGGRPARGGFRRDEAEGGGFRRSPGGPGGFKRSGPPGEGGFRRGPGGFKRSGPPGEGGGFRRGPGGPRGEDGFKRPGRGEASGYRSAPSGPRGEGGFKRSGPPGEGGGFRRGPGGPRKEGGFKRSGPPGEGGGFRRGPGGPRKDGGGFGGGRPGGSRPGGRPGGAGRGPRGGGKGGFRR